MAQKLLYVSYVGLMRFDQTDGKIVPNCVEPEGGYPCLLAKPLQHQLHRGLPHGVWGLNNRINKHKPQIAPYWPLLIQYGLQPARKGAQTLLLLLPAMVFVGGGQAPFYGQIIHRFTEHFSATATAQNAPPQH